MDVIVTLTAEAAGEDPLAEIARPPHCAALVELRLDLLPEIDVRAAVAACPLPLLATLRSAAEGGRGPDDPALRLPLLRAAREAGAAHVDVEFARDRAAIRALGLAPEQTVLSWHDPSATPADLERIADDMLATPAQLVKVVPTANGLADLERTLRLYHRPRTARRRLIAFAMGAVGVPSRLLAPLLGAPLAYCAWTDEAPAAPGQLSARRLRQTIGHLSGPPQRLFGVVGTDVIGSLSPMLHGAGYAALGLPDLMVPVSVPDPEDLERIFVPAGETLFDRIGLAAGGWAVTTPYKAAAAAAATVAAPRVRRSGSANTLVLRPRALFADTTDADGVVGVITAAGLDLEGGTAVVQGTGGAGRSAAVGLDLAGAEVYLRGRNRDHTRQVADAIGVDWLSPEQPPPTASFLVNATPLGSSSGDPLPFDEQEVNDAIVVVDLVYGSVKPALAEVAPHKYIEGRMVLAYQGLAQFAAFTGRMPPKDVMLDAIRREP